MFGFLHVLLSLFQQLFNATLLGIILGLLAVRSRSIVPGLLFHFLNNAMGRLAEHRWWHPRAAKPFVTWIYRNPAEGLYYWGWIVASALTSGLLLFHPLGSLNGVDRAGRLAEECRHWHRLRRTCALNGGTTASSQEDSRNEPVPLLFSGARLVGRRPMRRGTLTVQARYLYPVEGPPIRDGCLTIERGRIAWVGEASQRRGDLNLGNVAIVPGFVNAHTHLELEELRTGNGRATGLRTRTKFPGYGGLSSKGGPGRKNPMQRPWHATSRLRSTQEQPYWPTPRRPA